jgi:hypothetical protein
MAPRSQCIKTIRVYGDILASSHPQPYPTCLLATSKLLPRIIPLEFTSGSPARSRLSGLLLSNRLFWLRSLRIKST